MRIIRDDEQGVFILVSSTPEETDTFLAVASTLKSGEKMTYGGCETDENRMVKVVRLYAGARIEREDETTGLVTVRRNVYVGGVKIEVMPSSEEDRLVLSALRMACYYGQGGPYFIGLSDVSGALALLVTITHCKLCNKNMIDYLECEWAMCDACTTKCSHEYISGIVHGGRIDIGVGQFCKVCGRGKPRDPEEPEKTIAEHHMAAVQNGVVAIIYPGKGFLNSEGLHIQEESD